MEPLIALDGSVDPNNFPRKSDHDKSLDDHFTS